MNESETDEVLGMLGDTESVELDAQIESVTEEAAARVIMVAAVHRLAVGHHIRDAIAWRALPNGGFVGEVELGDDWGRLIYLRMSGWSRGVSETVDYGSKEYRAQWYEVRGLGASAQRPVVAVVHRSTGMLMEIFGCDKNTEMAEGVYQPRIRWEQTVESGEVTEVHIDVPDLLVDCVCKVVAGLVLSGFGREQEGARLLERGLTEAAI